MMLVSLVNKLVSASVGVSASTIFIGIMPSTPDACIALYEGPGQVPLEVLVSNTATLERPTVQVMVRGVRADYNGARTKILEVRDVLTAITDETLTGVRFLRVTTNGSITPLGVDDNDRPQFSLTFSTVIER